MTSSPMALLTILTLWGTACGGESQVEPADTEGDGDASGDGDGDSAGDGDAQGDGDDDTQGDGDSGDGDTRGDGDGGLDGGVAPPPPSDGAVIAPPDGGEPADDFGATNRASSLPVGIENVNDSPLKAASYRTLLRFVPDETITIDRFYFGFKLRGASCWDAGNAGYGAGDGGTLDAVLVNIDPSTGLPSDTLDSESVNGCQRHDEAVAELGVIAVVAWVNVEATLEAGKMYGVIVRNTHADPAGNFFSFNMPLAGTELAGPHARNELSKAAPGGLVGLDPREHVAWSSDHGQTWKYGSENGQYRSYLNDHDTDHPATRLPQYGFRIKGGKTRGVQPYYAYSTDCQGCTVAYANARYARSFSELGGFIAADGDVGRLTITNTSTGAQASCDTVPGFGFRTCGLLEALSVEPGQSYTIHATGAVEIMRMDRPQRLVFPEVGSERGELRAYQPNPAPGTHAKDVPSLWAGPLSAHFPAAGEH